MSGEDVEKNSCKGGTNLTFKLSRKHINTKAKYDGATLTKYIKW